ncbi:PorT family protein [Hymenobacter sp. DH14]|uniref:PorT family protein n=1 Tax=Hymenobacter cyanobacteriorum TaxID=2926463 RepID=A0A9X1VH21_9BACT|nr:porin family protein [Hymenobacter cyanobacteriorum]MCI1189049.1 PorT family protein [Hymenobacter cyanobacteriorum]
MLFTRGSLRNSQQCRFRPTSDAAAVEYSPTDLRAYAFADGPRYESQPVPPTQLLETHSEPQDLTPRPLFLEVLESGRASLYTRRDANDATHYYLRMAAAPAGPVQELENRLISREGYMGIQGETKPLYRSTLSAAFRDCLAVQPLLPQLPFTASNLTEVVRRYNSCSAVPTDAPKVATHRIRLRSGLVGGVVNSEMRFQGNITLKNGTFKSTASPTAGLFVTALLSPLNDRFHLRLEVLYEQLKYSSSYVARGFSSVDLTEQATFEWHSLHVPLQLRYHLRTAGVRPFIMGGVSGSYLLSSVRELRSEYPAGGRPVVSNGVAVPDRDINKYEFGLLAGAGLAVPVMREHSVSLEARAERSSGYVSNSNYAAPFFRYSALLSFNLF